MPYLKLDTNVAIPDDMLSPLLAKLSAALSVATGKPERGIQVVISGRSRMLLAGSEEPTAHVEVKGIRFDESLAPEATRAICSVLLEELGIEGTRVYIAFASYAGAMWGVDSRTF